MPKRRAETDNQQSAKSRDRQTTWLQRQRGGPDGTDNDVAEHAIRPTFNLGNSCYFNTTVQLAAPLRGFLPECARDWSDCVVGDRVTLLGDRQ